MSIVTPPAPQSTIVARTRTFVTNGTPPPPRLNRGVAPYPTTGQTFPLGNR